MRFYLGKASRRGGVYLYLVCLRPPISYAYLGGIRQFIVQIPSMDAVLMVYWVTYQVEIKI